MGHPPTTSTTGYTGPALTGPQLDALRSVAERGDLLHVNPTRARTLAQRGLIDVPDWSTLVVPATLTDTGRQVLADAALTLPSGATIPGDHINYPFAVGFAQTVLTGVLRRGNLADDERERLSDALAVLDTAIERNEAGTR